MDRWDETDYSNWSTGRTFSCNSYGMEKEKSVIGKLKVGRDTSSSYSKDLYPQIQSLKLVDDPMDNYLIFLIIEL